MGNVLEIITKEIFIIMLYLIVREAVQSQQGDSKDDDVCDLYIRIKRQPDHFMVQEVKGIKLEESFGKYKLDQSPYIPLRMVRVSAENYGRSYVEEYLGDLISLEGLSKAIVKAHLHLQKHYLW